MPVSGISVLLLMGGLAQAAGSEAVLPAYLIGLAVAGVFVADRVLVHRMRAIAFALLTPFYFLRAGSFVSLPAVVGGAGLIALFLAVKIGAKVLGVWPTARAFGLPVRDANYTTLLMSTGLTFGTIAALYGYTNGYIDQPTHTIRHGRDLERGRPHPCRDDVLRAPATGADGREDFRRRRRSMPDRSTCRRQHVKVDLRDRVSPASGTGRRRPTIEVSTSGSTGPRLPSPRPPCPASPTPSASTSPVRCASSAG
jgi:hypothetical protein